MRRNSAAILVGALCALLVGLVLFTFQVRQTEVAVVTTFGRFGRALTEPGLYGRWFWPVQKVYKFDNRVQNFERKFEQTTTADARNLIVTVFVGWRVADPRMFLERFPNGDLTRAAQSLEGLVRDAKNGVIGRHRFAELISTNRSRLGLREIEGEMLAVIQPRAATNYGVAVDLVGVKQFGLPESITSKVFDRMKAERQRLVKQFQSEGEAEAIRIRSEADRRRQELLAAAEAEALVIRGQGEAEAAKSFAVFERNPELAVFLLEIRALANSLKDRSTLVLDPQTPPFSLLRGSALGGSRPAALAADTPPSPLRSNAVAASRSPGAVLPP
jgi:membrane protease subunit HflC